MSVSEQISVAVHMLMTTDRIGLAQKAFLGQLAPIPKPNSQRTNRNSRRSVIPGPIDPSKCRFR